jgi:hypothetical protein
MAGESDVVLGELRGAVGIARLNRPDARNALSSELLALLGEMVEAWDADPEVRCIVIAGSDDYFAAGADIKAMRDRSFQEAMVTPSASFWILSGSSPAPAALSGSLASPASSSRWSWCSPAAASTRARRTGSGS